MHEQTYKLNLHINNTLIAILDKSDLDTQDNFKVKVNSIGSSRRSCHKNSGKKLIHREQPNQNKEMKIAIVESATSRTPPTPA